jgi:ABC-type transport system involved in multi-copper enzyme maturation permease subunit
MVAALRQLWLDNPVLTKELRVRMRGARAYWILTGYLVFLSFILFLQYTIWWNEAQRSGGGLSGGSKIGQQFFQTISIVQAFLVAFITPAITSGAITIEREQRTLEMLEMTRLSRVSIVTGKLFSAISFVALLLISSLPLTSICFFLGGVSPEEVIYRYLILLAGSFLAGGLGLAWSTVARSTATAVIFTYGSLLVPLFVVGVYALLSDNQRSHVDDQLIATCALSVYGLPTPGWDWSPLAGFYRAWDMRHFYALSLPVWVAPVLTYGLIGLLLAAISTARIEHYPERRGYLLRGFVIAIFVQQLFFYFGARFFPYTGSAPMGLAAAMTPYSLIGMLAFPVTLLLAAVPVFSTGELRPIEARSFTRFLLGGWLPRGWKKGKLSSGLPFLCLLTLVIFGMYCLSFAVVGQPGGALTGEVKVAGAPARTVQPPAPPNILVPFTPQPPLPGPTPNPEAGNLLHVALAVFAAVVGLSSLGMLYSVMARNRWTALMLSGATLLVILIVPILSKSAYVRDGGSPGIFINLFYLNPLIAVSQAADTDGSFWRGLPLLFGHTPVWQVTVAAYAMITLVSLVMAGPFVTRIAARPVLPYEDLASRV